MCVESNVCQQSANWQDTGPAQIYRQKRTKVPPLLRWESEVKYKSKMLEWEHERIVINLDSGAFKVCVQECMTERERH